MLKTMIEFVLHLYLKIQKDEVFALGAQLSYFFILSAFPFLIFLLTLLNYTSLTQGHTLNELSLILPDTIFFFVKQIITEISVSNNATLLSLGFLGTIWTASRGTYALIRNINKAYDIEESRSFLKLNTVGILTTFALALVILFSLGLLVFGKVIGIVIFQNLGLEYYFNILWFLLRYFIIITVIFVVFSFIYLYSPNCQLLFRDIYPGAIFSTLGWIGASQFFAYYVNNFANFTITYGSLGGIIVFLIWLYISSIVMLLGAEINAALLDFSRRSKMKNYNINV